MTKTEVKKIQGILEMRAIELSAVTRRRDGIVIEKSAESLESLLQAVDREFAVRTLEAEWAKLREVRAALQRIREGTYGICVECEEEISPKRLAAVPASALCIRCQAAADCRCGAINASPLLAMAA
jgi:DnaK suppressor protein